MPFRKSALMSMLIPLVGLVGLTVTLFWPVHSFSFIGFDDPEYITKNAHVITGLTWENIRWAFTSTYASNWHPLTWIFHMLDVQLFGVYAGPQHVINGLLHAFNSAFLFVALRSLTRSNWRSAVVAALFAVHPCHVESVAWLAERKDLLSTFFGLLALWFYAQSSSKQEPKRKWIFLATSWLFFSLSLLSKPMLVTLPFLLPLLDYWPLHRFTPGKFSFPQIKALLLEKIPFLLLTIASCIITYIAQSTGGAVETLERVSFPDRLTNALIAYAFYLKNLFWPFDLAILYLRPAHWPPWSPWLAFLLLAFLTLLLVGHDRFTPFHVVRSVFFKRRAAREQLPGHLSAYPSSNVSTASPTHVSTYPRIHAYLTVGWLWFLGTLVPVIGLVQVGNQFMADRYTYFPYIGLFILLVWGAADLFSSVSSSFSSSSWGVFLRALPWLVATITICVLSAVTMHQLPFWQNTETLFGHCVAVTKNNFVAHNILAASLDPKTRFTDAKAHFEAALQIQPGYLDAQRNLGVLLTDHGDYQKALEYLDKSIQARPELGSIYVKLALIVDNQGRGAAAVPYYQRALAYNPNDVQSLNNLAWILATHPDSAVRNGQDAVALAQHACDLTSSTLAPLLGTLAAAYAEAGQAEKAIAAAEKAISLAESSGQPQLAARNRELRDLYKQGKAFHEK